MDSTLWGIPYSDWRIYNSFAPWIAAIATIFISSIALWLATKDKYIRLKLNMSIAYYTGPNYNPTLKQMISISILNKGIRKATINNLGFYINSKTYQMLPSKNHLNSEYPITLSDGESANYYLENSDFLEVMNRFNNGKLKGIKIFTMSSTGKMCKKRLTKGVKNVINTELKRDISR